MPFNYNEQYRRFLDDLNRINQVHWETYHFSRPDGRVDEIRAQGQFSNENMDRIFDYLNDSRTATLTVENMQRAIETLGSQNNYWGLSYDAPSIIFNDVTDDVPEKKEIKNYKAERVNGVNEITMDLLFRIQK